MKSDRSSVGSILIFGGTFDPPHFGHLNVALNVQRYFNFERFIFLPCKNSVLKHSSLATPQQRMEMLKILLKNHPEFSINTWEIDRNTPSYMTFTLQEFRRVYGSEISLTILLGEDAFANLEQWHEWHKIPKLCNSLVINREGQNRLIPQRIKQAFDWLSNPLEVHQYPHGKAVSYNAGSYDISSTGIRHKLQTKANTDADLFSEIQEYIKLNSLYLNPDRSPPKKE